MATVLITGGTGLIGSYLVPYLKALNYTVRVLTRNPKKKNEFKWDLPTNFADDEAFKNIDYIIHLAGAGITDKRWAQKRKELIVTSRVQSTNLLYQKVKELKIPLKGFISASGIGYYGAITGNKIMTENDAAGNDFLASVCVAWEKAALQFTQLHSKTVILRTGMVLTPKGGALAKMKAPIMLPFGSGNQYINWIHITDLCALYCKAIEDINCIGIYNAVAPNYKTNKDFLLLLAKKINSPFLSIKIPAFLLKLILGNMATILLTGCKISSKKIENNNYIFTFSTLNNALDDLL